MDTILNLVVSASMFWYNYYLGRLSYKLIDFMFNAEVPTIKKPVLKIVDNNFEEDDGYGSDLSDREIAFIEAYERQEAISKLDEAEVIEETKNNTNNFSSPIKQEYGVGNRRGYSSTNSIDYLLRKNQQKKEVQVLYLQ